VCHGCLYLFFGLAAGFLAGAFAAFLAGFLAACLVSAFFGAGFASDFVGLALKSPSVRQSLARRLRARSGSADPRIIDLDPREWRREARSSGGRPRRSTAK